MIDSQQGPRFIGFVSKPVNFEFVSKLEITIIFINGTYSLFRGSEHVIFNEVTDLLEAQLWKIIIELWLLTHYLQC